MVFPSLTNLYNSLKIWSPQRARATSRPQLRACTARCSRPMAARCQSRSKAARRLQLRPKIFTARCSRFMMTPSRPIISTLLTSSHFHVLSTLPLKSTSRVGRTNHVLLRNSACEGVSRGYGGTGASKQRKEMVQKTSTMMRTVRKGIG